MTHSWIAERTGSFDSSGIRKVFDLAAKMKDPIRSFFTEAEAIEFCNQSTAMNLIVERNIFSGKFDVYDMAAR